MATTLTNSYQLICSKTTSTYSIMKVYAKIDSKDEANLTTTILVQPRILGTSNSGGSWVTGSVYTTIPNSADSPMTSTCNNVSYSKSKGEVTLATQTFTIQHASDGSYANKTLSCKLTTSSQSNVGGTATGVITLPSLSTASTISIAGTLLIGAHNNLTITNYDNTYKNTIAYTLGGSSGTIVSDYVGTSYDWVIPSSLASECAYNQSTKQGSLTITTYKSDGTYVGQKTQNFTYEVYVRPVISNVVKKETNADVIAGLGTDNLNQIVINLTKPRIQADLSIEAGTGAYLKRIDIESGSFSDKIEFTSNITSYSLDYTFASALTDGSFKFKITDTRGLINSRTYDNLTTSTYTPLAITSQQLERSGLAGDISIQLNGSMQPKRLDDVNKNSVSASYEYKLVDEQNWTTPTSPSLTITYDDDNNRTKWYINQVVGSWCLYNKAYNVRITIQDTCNPSNPIVSKEYTINKSVPTMSLGENDLQINGDLIVADEDGDNGVNILDEIKKRDNFIIVCHSGDQTLSNQNTLTIVNLNTNNQSKGNLLTFDSANHKVVIGAGVNHIEVSGSVYVSAVGSSGVKNLYIYRKRGSTETMLCRTLMNMTNNYNTLAISPKISPVEEGDEITLRFLSANGTTTKISGDNGAATNRLFIRVID